MRLTKVIFTYTWRELYNYIANLPTNCATFIAQDERNRWNETQYMIADLIDCVINSSYQFALVHTEKKDKKKLEKNPPKPYPRPGVKIEEEETGATYGKVNIKTVEEFREVQQGLMDRL